MSKQDLLNSITKNYPLNSLSSSSVHVLLIQDSPADAHLIQDLLGEQNSSFTVEWVYQLSAGLQRLAEGEIDIVLLDLSFPDSQGISAFLRLRPEASHIPIVVLTAAEHDELGTEAVCLGAQDYLLKTGLNRATLMRTLRCALERKRVEERLRQSEESYRQIVEFSNDAIIGTTLDGLITTWNVAAERIYGFSEAEAVGKPITILAPPGRADEGLELLEKIKKGASILHLETTRMRKDGKEIDISLTASPIGNQAGGIIGASAIVQDITERKQMEEALRRSEANFRSLVENSPYGVLRITPDSRILQVNPALVEMLGYGSASEVLGLSMAKDLYRDAGEGSGMIDEFRRQGNARGVEVEWKRQDGTPVAVRYGRHAVGDNQAGAEYYEVVVEDITERRVMEHQLRQAQKMEALGALAGGVAHDFNNLLGVMIGYCEIFLDQLNHGDPLRAHAEEIKKAGDRATSLTRQLLAFSHQQAFEVKIVNLNGVVAEMENTLRHLGEDIELHISLDPALGNVKADPGQIEQVIMNLAANARDSMPKGGKLLIETTNVDLNQEYVMRHPPLSPGRYAMLAVSDTGIGMDLQTQTHIFEPFYTTKTNGKGNGLGLATVYGVVKQSGGNIWVYSEPGIGSTFKVCLPRVDGEIQRTRPSDSKAGTARGSETILLVEDEQSLRNLIHLFLEESGYTVLEADSGDRAIELARLRRDPIDMLLTDVVMPGTNGRAVAEGLVSTHPETKVVYMSGYTGSSVTHRGLLDSHAVFLQKPFTRDALLRKLQEVLELQQEPKQG